MHLPPRITENSLNLSSDALSSFIFDDLIKDIMNPWGYNTAIWEEINFDHFISIQNFSSSTNQLKRYKDYDS